MVASFLGTGAFADRVSGSVSHVVTRGQTKTQIAADHPNSRLRPDSSLHRYGERRQAPRAGLPGGSVTVLADGNAVGTVPVVNGTAALETALFHAGPRSITAAYSGDANFESSSASAVQQNVGKARTHVDATAGSVFIGTSPAINVSVSVAGATDLVRRARLSQRRRHSLGMSPFAGGSVELLTCAALRAAITARGELQRRR